MSKKRNSIDEFASQSPLIESSEHNPIINVKRRGSIIEHKLNDSNTEYSMSNSTSNNNRTDNIQVPSNIKIGGHNHRRNYSVPAMPGSNHNKRPSLSDQSSQQVLQFLQNDLNPKQRQKMRKLSTDLRTERDVKHLKIKLAEAEEQRDTAIEIIGNLERENEDYEGNNERLKIELQQAMTENKILNHKIQSLQEMYKEELDHQNDDLADAKEQIEELKKTNETNQMLIAQHQERETQYKQLNRLTSSNVDNDNNDSTNIEAIKNQINKYKNLYDVERKKNKDNNDKINVLFKKLENFTRMEVENQKLKQEIKDISSMAQEDLVTQDLSRQRMQHEVIELAARNSALEKEKEDLIELLEQRDYEAEMLKQQLEFTKYNNNVPSTPSFNPGIKSNNMFNDMENAINLNDDVYNDYSYEINEEPEPEQKVEQPKPEPVQAPPKPKDTKDSKYRKKPETKKTDDINREFLFIAASVILIKHPKVRNISSAELIQKVKHYPFEDYYDKMLQIVKLEERKQIEQDKQKKLEARKQQMERNKKKKGGRLFGFLSKFGPSSFTNDKPNNNNNNKLNKNQTTINNSQTRSRPHSVSVKRSKAPKAPKTLKNRINGNNNTSNNSNGNNKGFKSKSPKNGNVNDNDRIESFMFKKQDKDKKMKAMAQQDFVMVPSLGGPKPDKPPQL